MLIPKKDRKEIYKYLFKGLFLMHFCIGLHKKLVDGWTETHLAQSLYIGSVEHLSAMQW